MRRLRCVRVSSRPLAGPRLRAELLPCRAVSSCARCGRRKRTPQTKKCRKEKFDQCFHAGGRDERTRYVTV